MGKLLSVAARQGKINRIMESLTSRETIQILRSHKIIEITEIIKITKCVYRPRHLQLEDDAPARRLTPLNAPWDPGSVLFRASSSQTIIQPPDFFPAEEEARLAGRKLGFGTLDPPVSKSRKSRKMRRGYKGNAKEMQREFVARNECAMS